MRVLLVDDDGGVRQSVIAVLHSIPDIALLGEASDGKFALALTRAMRPDVVIMDIDMPIMGGVEAARAIQADCPGVRVIGIAVNQPRDRIQAMLDAGAIACVNKIDSLYVLLTAIARSAKSRKPRNGD